MSEFEQNWPMGDIRDHERYIAQGVEHINDRLILPSDGRWEMAYGALAMGDPKASVLAEGEPGTGKTQFGNIVFGEDLRIDIASTDTAERLEGYLRPTDGVFNPGKMPLDQENMRLFLNEISHLRDTGPLHKYWDGSELLINGVRYPLDNAPVYATTNFADGGRAKKLDTALRSRMGLTVLAGDDVSSIASYVQGRDLGRAVHATENEGILPPPKARQQIREALQAEHHLGSHAGEYMAMTMKNLNETGMFTPVNASDARIGQGWQQAVRARRLVEGGASRGTQINPEDLAYVAPLALGSVAVLSHKGGALFQESLGKIDTLSPLEKAVIARRLVAAVAIKTFFDMKTLENVSEEKVARHLDHYAYANSTASDAINEVAIEAVIGTKNKSQEVHNEPKSRKLFGRRSK